MSIEGDDEGLSGELFAADDPAARIGDGGGTAPSPVWDFPTPPPFARSRGTTERHPPSPETGPVARVLVLLSDEHLRMAVTAALEEGWSAKAMDARSYLAARTLHGEGWDVCVADRASADEALRARRGRGVVVLDASGRPFATPRGSDDRFVFLRIPCTARTLRDAVRAASAVARPITRTIWDGLDADHRLASEGTGG